MGGTDRCAAWSAGASGAAAPVRSNPSWMCASSRAKRRARWKAKYTNLSADTMAGMIRKYRWMEIGLTLSFAGLACGRTALDELPAGATGTMELRGVFVPTDDMAVARYLQTATLLEE